MGEGPGMGSRAPVPHQDKQTRKGGRSMKSTRILAVVVTAVALCLMGAGAWGKEVRGVSDTEVKLGFMVDFTGPGKYSGPPLAMGGEIYTKYINDQGGINGRKIKLLVEDNGILPNTTMEAAKKLILKDEIFAIAFNLGSSGSTAILPLCEENQVVMMPHGANKRFYDPGNKWVFVPYSTQYNMAAVAVEYVLSKNPQAKIGIIYQDDDFGIDGLEGARNAAKFMKSSIVKEAPYKIGTVDMSPQMALMKEANVDWILLWAYLPQIGSILKEKQKMGWDVKLIGNNTTAYPTLFPLVGDLAEGYLAVTPVAPWENIADKYKQIIKKYGDFDKVNDPNFPTGLLFGAWAYCAAMIEGIKNAGRDLTPETLIKGLESMNLDMGGICPNISFTPKRHCGYFSSMVLEAKAKEKKWVIVQPIMEPKSPQ